MLPYDHSGLVSFAASIERIMLIHQFEDKSLSHFSYAILDAGEMALVDPSRDPQPYVDFATSHRAKITAIIETHPHADFVSSHLELHQRTGAPIYVSKELHAQYPHHPLEEGDVIKLGKAWLQVLFTPGHSPDSISILAHDASNQPVAVFTGDTLFIGDCGRPDLREKAGGIHMDRVALARRMYHSLREKLLPLPDQVKVYPAHGAGSLCGRGLSEATHSTIGAEKISNWSLQPMSEETFVHRLLKDQPFIPAYFPFDVEINRRGAPPLQDSLACVPMFADQPAVQEGIPIVDARPEAAFKAGFLPNAINLMEDTRFETWLGTLIAPEQSFYLAAADTEQLHRLLYRIAKIGYEPRVLAAFVMKKGNQQLPKLDVHAFRLHPEQYTIVDVRDTSEVQQRRVFPQALHIPLQELRDRISEIPTHKPVVVHCAGGFRSAAAASLLYPYLKDRTQIYDLSTFIQTF